MAKTNAERLGILEEKTDNIDKKVDRILIHLDNLDDKYASKYVERAVNGLIGIVIVAVIGALLTLVLK